MLKDLNLNPSLDRELTTFENLLKEDKSSIKGLILIIYKLLNSKKVTETHQFYCIVPQPSAL